MSKNVFVNVCFCFVAIALLQVCFPTRALAQPDEGMGKITLNPYLPESENIGAKATKALLSKLGQIATAAGMSGKGFEQRFIITAHLQEIDCETTATYPPKTAVRTSVTIYVGDGVDGTLFSSYTREYKGVGDNREDAYASVVRKLEASDAGLLRSVEVGKERIVKYYNQISGNIMKTAEAEASAGHYEEAISLLFSIPMACKDYDAAQALIERYGFVALETSNMKLIADARAAWSSAPNEEGASVAMDLLNQLKTPSETVLAEAKKLSDEMAERLKTLSDREWQQTAIQTQNEHEEKMAQTESAKQQGIAWIKAVASVAETYYRNRPRIAYHIRWW